MTQSTESPGYSVPARATKKHCNACGQDKDVSSFYPRKQRSGPLSRYKAHCKPCDNAATRRDYRNRSRDWRVSGLKRYGLTETQFDAMVVAQCGVCAICARPPKAGRLLHVDHDHLSGENRGLLCTQCNVMLGMAHDDIDVLLAGAAYLNRRRAP